MTGLDEAANSDCDVLKYRQIFGDRRPDLNGPSSCHYKF